MRDRTKVSSSVGSGRFFSSAASLRLHPIMDLHPALKVRDIVRRKGERGDVEVCLLIDVVVTARQYFSVNRKLPLSDSTRSKPVLQRAGARSSK